MTMIKQIIGLGLLLLAACPWVQAQEEELLPPEQAFALQAWVDGDALVVEAGKSVEVEEVSAVARNPMKLGRRV